MRKTNILILSCGTRYKLVDYFKKSKYVNKVVVTDCSELAPALYATDKHYLIPSMKEEGYLDVVLDICKKEEIDAVITLQEDELLLTALNANRYKEIGVLPIVSEHNMVNMCRDKYEFCHYLQKNDVSVVPTFQICEFDQMIEQYSGHEIFIKPRFGAGSVDTFKVKKKNTIEALRDEFKEELIIQPALCGKEYGVDVYVDMISGEVVALFIKQKLRMRAGETEKSVTVDNEQIKKLVIKAVGLLGLRGPLDVDVLEEDGKIYILEINPRFGGGYPHAYECGEDFIKLIAKNGINEINEVNLQYNDDKCIVMKYSDVYVMKK